MCDFSIQSTENLKNLSTLLNPKGDSSDDDGDAPDYGQPTFTPASIGTSKKGKAKDTPYAKTVTNEKDIWAEEEVSELSVFAEDADKRPQPEYDISYKQKVTTEDMFLGMSGKDPSSACCEAIVVKIKLPGAKVKEVELDIKETYLDCRSPNYRLLLPLPHPVDSKKGNAKWDGNTEILEVSLILKREYDFVNFQ